MTENARPTLGGGLRPVVVGVAGHIDHGKSTLVRALTGTDPDRLPEEKRRGITIDLGFAHLDVEEISLSFVDAPGHEKFVHNMLAGATGIDVLLLVVAADESVMPQTREHLGICRLLDIRSGVVALTRIDLADKDLIELAEDDVRRLVRGTFLAEAPIIRVSGATGEGLPELRAALLATARRAPARAAGPWPRLPIDRVFAAKGFGTVVTGTLSGGLLRVGQTLVAIPGDLEGRVRGLQVHGAPALEAGPHGRVAVNLQGIPRERLTRGMVLAPPGRQVVATVFDARVEVLDEAPAPLADGQRVRVHHGAAEVMGRLRLPAPGRITPGGDGACQLRVEAPLAVLPGDRFVLRRYSPVTTLGGGVVVDLDPPRWRRSDEQWPAHVNLLAGGDAAVRLASAAVVAGEDGVSLTSRATRLGLEPARARELAEELATGAAAAAPVTLLGGDRLVFQPALERLAARLSETLSRAHRERPLEAGLALEPLRAQVTPAWDAASFRDWLTRLEAKGLIAVTAEGARLGGHAVELSGADKALYERMTRVLEAVGLLAIPEEEWLRNAEAGPEGKRLVGFAVKRGDAVRLKDGALVSAAAWRGMVERLRREAAAGRSNFAVPEFKEWFSLTRKHAIPILEKLDDQGVTQRVGDLRRIRPA